MCGRYSIAVEPKELEKRFHASFVGEFVPRYNAAPSQNLPIILNETPDKISAVHWGLMPPWLEKIKKRDGIINVRAETLREKPTFKSHLLKRRCLILVDGFYEWAKSQSKKKVPYRFTLKKNPLFALAGIWEADKDREGNPMNAFAIITTSANEIMAPIHDRMPVIIEPGKETDWLKPQLQLSEIWDRLDSKPSKNLDKYEVSTKINSGKYDAAELIKPQI